jgi:hypothetical protein
VLSTSRGVTAEAPDLRYDLSLGRELGPKLDPPPPSTVSRFQAKIKPDLVKTEDGPGSGHVRNFLPFYRKGILYCTRNTFKISVSSHRSIIG